jgi:AraC-like DNA-binding protein
MHNAGPNEPRCLPALTRVTDHVKRHLAEPLPLQTLAALAGLSPWRFSLVFRQHMGVPPHRYISLCRIERARELLQQGVSAATVADACGFYDQSHFTRHFKHHCGMTPGQYALHPASATSASPLAGLALPTARSV